MNLLRALLQISMTMGLILVSANPGLNQSGTQSDVTLPNPLEIVPPINDLESGENRSGSNTSSLRNIKVDRNSFESVFQQSGFDRAIQLFEELQAVDFSQYFGFNLFGKTVSVEEISETLCNLAQRTGKKTAVIYVVSLVDRLEVLLIIPKSPPCTETTAKQNNQFFTIRQVIPEANGSAIEKIAKEFRANVTDLRSNDGYQPAAKQLYQWIVSPIEPVLLANKIDTLVFSMDKGLRSIPIAALYNGKQFIIERYSVALIPSFSLTDTRYVPIANLQMLAMGISKSTQAQTPLPAVAVEVPTLADRLWQGRGFLNEESTLDNLQSVSRQQSFGIIHIATHAEFKAGKVNESYIQFWNNKLKLNELRQLSQNVGWENAPKVEMLVLSACRTALGNEQAELGFAGLAVQAGVKTAIGSLWYASDEGSLALMTEFYAQLRSAPIKTEALQQAQLGMLKGQVRIEGGQLQLSDGLRVPLPPELNNASNMNLSHPYFWSGYTMIGNWN